MNVNVTVTTGFNVGVVTNTGNSVGVISDGVPLSLIDALYYPRSNPSGFTSTALSGSYVLSSQTGALTGTFYPLTNPSGFITGLCNIDNNHRLLQGQWMVNIGSGLNNSFSINDGSNQIFSISEANDLDGTGVGTYALSTSGIYGQGGQIIFVSPYISGIDGDLLFRDFNGISFYMNGESLNVSNGGINVESLTPDLLGGAFSIDTNTVIDSAGNIFVSGNPVVTQNQTGQFLTNKNFTGYIITLNSGIEVLKINFPFTFAKSPVVTCDIENNIDTFIYSYTITSVNTSGFTINFSDILTNSGYLLHIQAKI